MEAPVIAALVSGGFAIVAPIVTFIGTKAYETRFLDHISPGRRKALVGTWEGVAQQEFGPDGKPVNLKATMTFTTSRKLVIGEGTYRLPDDSQARFRFSGGFLHDRFLRFNYTSAEAGVIQFGSIILELSPDAKEFRGRFQGFGVQTKRMVYGDVVLRKAA